MDDSEIMNDVQIEADEAIQELEKENRYRMIDYALLVRNEGLFQKLIN
jgi:trans-2-enoyl-CoA reductase